jgi:hypothetical protein
MRDESGMELDWFWRDWIFTTSRLDQSVDSVSNGVIHLTNRGTMVMPAELAVTFTDGTRTTVGLPVEMWNLGSHFDYHVAEKKQIGRVEVDPHHALPDIDRSNNVWPR